MDPTGIEDYIRQNRGKYTREAIREQLVAKGHEPAAVDGAWDRITAASPLPGQAIGWRPGWREFLGLLLVGTVGAAIVWAGEPYGAGGIAPIVYAILLSIGFGVTKLISVVIDRGGAGRVAIMMGIVSVLAIALAFLNMLSLIFLGIAGAAVLLTLLLFLLRGTNQRVAGIIGAALPILAWLAITGTCYAPLFAGLRGA